MRYGRSRLRTFMSLKVGLFWLTCLREQLHRAAAEKAKHLNVVHFINQRPRSKLFMIDAPASPIYKSPGCSSFKFS